MKITTSFITNLKPKEVQDKVRKATKQGLKDSLTDIAGDVIKNAPPPPKIGTRYISTGHNKRSIRFEVGPGKEVAKGELEGAVYSTSGYGGYLEVGTHNDDGSWRMPPRPYFKPALDMNMKNLPKNIKVHLE